jgi:hypothetical protein
VCERELTLCDLFVNLFCGFTVSALDVLFCTLEHVLNKSDTVVESLRNVSNYLAAAKQVGMGQIYLPADVQNNIDKVQRMISNSSITLENKIKKNFTSIQHVLDSV